MILLLHIRCNNGEGSRRRCRKALLQTTKPPGGEVEKWTFQLFSASALKFNFAELFLAVLFGVSHHRVFSVLSGVNRVAPRGVGMVCRLFVISCVVMLGRFSVVAGGSIARIGMWEEPACRKRDRS